MRVPLVFQVFGHKSNGSSSNIRDISVWISGVPAGIVFGIQIIEKNSHCDNQQDHCNEKYHSCSLKKKKETLFLGMLHSYVRSGLWDILYLLISVFSTHPPINESSQADPPLSVCLFTSFVRSVSGDCVMLSACSLRALAPVLFCLRRVISPSKPLANSHT